MKLFNRILQIVIIFFLCQFEAATSQNNRLRTEIGEQLFLIEPEGSYTWKQAVAECKREHFHLIEPKGDYDYAKLKDVIKHNFKNYSSFWTNTRVKWTTLFHHIGLGREEHNRQKCNKFENSTSFKFLPDNCDNQFGFICERSRLKDYPSFKIKNIVYFVHPVQEFTCEEAYNQCEKRQMSLVVLNDHENNRLLKDYLRINYNSSVSFWFGYNNETHYNCATNRKGQVLKYNSKLGFICQRERLQSRAMTMRHIILLVLVTVAAFLAALIFVVLKSFCSRKVESFNLPEAYFSEETKNTEII